MEEEEEKMRRERKESKMNGNKKKGRKKAKREIEYMDMRRREVRWIERERKHMGKILRK